MVSHGFLQFSTVSLWFSHGSRPSPPYGYFEWIPASPSVKGFACSWWLRQPWATMSAQGPPLQISVAKTSPTKVSRSELWTSCVQRKRVPCNHPHNSSVLWASRILELKDDLPAQPCWWTRSGSPKSELQNFKLFLGNQKPRTSMSSPCLCMLNCLKVGD